MRRAVGIWGLLGAALGWGCTGPSLEVPESLGSTVHVDFQPNVGEGVVAQLFRGRLGNVPASARPWLFRGELSDYYVRSLKHGDVPSALQERAVPLRYWHAGDDCMLQPLEWLQPETSYSLALTGVGVVLVAQAQAGAEHQSRRLFPPPGATKPGLRWCASSTARKGWARCRSSRERRRCFRRRGWPVNQRAAASRCK